MDRGDDHPPSCRQCMATEMTLNLQVRVNSKTLSQHKGKTIRLTAKVVKIVGDVATVEASDGGEVRCRILATH